MNGRKKIAFIVPYPKGKAPSQRFRFEQYLQLIESEGHQVDIYSFLDEKAWNTLYSEGNTFSKILAILRGFLRRITMLFRLRSYHTLFIHREASMIGPPVFEWIIAKVLRKKFIYDFDDAIWLPNYSDVNARFQRLKMYSKVNKIMRWADQITAGNQYLCAYAAQFNNKVTLIPTTIDTVNHHHGNCVYDTDLVRIGWTGSHTTQQYLDFLVPILRDITTSIPFEFCVISNENPKLDLPNFCFIPWNKSTEIEDLKTFHIGVMPLTDDQWAQGKCGFKALQYMSLGIPTIVSPVGVNKQIIEHTTNGYHATAPEEWKNLLTLLIEDAALRKNIGQLGKDTVQGHYSVQANWTNYQKVLDL